MGLSKSKTKSEATPYAAATPAINAGIAASSDIFNSQQPVLAGLASSAQTAYNSIAPGAFQTSPYVSSAQNAASKIFNQGTNNNPGSSTYSTLMSQSNPGLAALQGLQGGGSNPAGSGYANLATNGGGISAQGVAAGTVNAPTGTAASNQLYTDTLGGKYLNGNPYIDNVAQQATDAATRAANQRFGAAGLGAGLSSAYTDVLSRNVADASNTVRYQNYNDERARQLAAAGQSDALYNADASRQLQASTGNADRALTADQANAANSLTAQQANLNAQLSGLGGLASTSQQQYANQLAAASGLGSLYNSQQQTQLGAAQASDAGYNAQQQQALSALGLTGSLSDAQYAGISPALNLLNASASIPYTGVAALAGNLNTLAGRYGVTTGSSTPSLASLLAQSAGNAASAYAGG